MTELLSLFPKCEVATLLVDTYFDRVHWFMLLFHQDDFRQRWQQAYQYSTEQLTKNSQNAGFISTFLMVLAIGLQYAGEHRKSLLDAYGVDTYRLRDNILNTIRTRLLDIVSLGSLEAAQTCVLLGTYYLYHGNPGLAWPVCGCGLRIAQALNLHRKLPLHSSATVGMRQQYETRKRCWWAIYEIETFCSMSYGYPHSVKDSDCDIELLDPLSRTSTGHSPTSLDETQQCSLLSYKYFMSKLSILTKSILTELYGISQDKANYPKSSSDLHRLAQKWLNLIHDYSYGRITFHPGCNWTELILLLPHTPQLKKWTKILVRQDQDLRTISTSYRPSPWRSPTKTHEFSCIVLSSPIK